MNHQNGIQNEKGKVVSTYVADNNWSDGEQDLLTPQSTVCKNGFVHSRGRPINEVRMLNFLCH